MSQPYLGEVKMFGFNFAPRNWATCSGQSLSIAQNTALFSLLGTIYGGNGTTTFALPDLRARRPIHFGQLSGGSPYSQGQASGTESETISEPQMPLHTHLPAATTADGTKDDPTGNIWAAGSATSHGTTTDQPMNTAAVGDTGGSQPHNNMPPYLVVLFAIALGGIYPSRN